jgi:hypothetical protein
MDAFLIGTRGRLFYMDIPHTADMPMRQYLDEQYHPDEICPAENWQDLHGREHEVRSFLLVRGHFRYNLRELVARETRMLVVLRDPLHRTVSALRHLASHPDLYRKHELAKDVTVEEMIRDRQIMSHQRDVQARFLCASQPAAVVSAYLKEALSQNRQVDAGDLESPPDFPSAVERLMTIDFVGIAEDPGNFVSPMAREMQFHPPLSYPFANQNPDRIDPLVGLTEEELDIVREHNVIDSQLYDFGRKLVNWRNSYHAMERMVRNGVYRVPPASFEIQISDILPGSGWYPAERNGDSSGRWTGPGKQFTIEVPLRQDASYRFNMTFNDPRPLGPKHLAVEINNFPIAFELSCVGSLFRCEFDIDQSVLGKSFGFCQILFHTGDTVNLTQAGHRLVGISVRRIEFKCLDQ